MPRNCIVCLQVDDHPRDVVDIGNGAVAYHHHDCGALMNPPCPSCTWLVQHKGSLVGQDWADHVIDLHTQLSDKQRALKPHERDVVESHINGTVAN